RDPPRQEPRALHRLPVLPEALRRLDALQLARRRVPRIDGRNPERADEGEVWGTVTMASPTYRSGRTGRWVRGTTGESYRALSRSQPAFLPLLEVLDHPLRVAPPEPPGGCALISGDLPV